MSSARVVAWAWWQARQLNKALHEDGMDAIDRITPSPAVEARHRFAVAGVMRATRATCLVRSAILQRFDADHGVERPLVIGVSRDYESPLAAHAWLEGERHASFEELLRRPPPHVTRGPGAGNAVS